MYTVHYWISLAVSSAAVNNFYIECLFCATQVEYFQTAYLI